MSQSSATTALLEEFRRAITCVGGQRLIKPKPHPGQEAFLDSDAPARVLIGHRRLGKDYACVMDMRRRIPGWLEEPHRRLLSPAVRIGVIYPTHELASEFWGALKRMTPKDEAERVLENPPRQMRLMGDVLIEVRSAKDPTSIVAAGYDLLIFGEAGLLHPDAWQTAHATLASAGRAGMAVFQGTPRGQNWFAGLWRDCLDAKPGWWGRRIPIWQDGTRERHPLSNPHVTDEAVAREEREMTTRWFAQEWMADFLTSEGAVFRNVRERVGAAPADRAAPVVVGVDLAKHRDFTVFAAFDARGRMVASDRMQLLPYPAQAERLLNFLVAVGAKKCVIESNGPGEPFHDMLLLAMWERRQDPNLRCELIPFATTATTKSAMVNALVVAFEKGEVTILDDPILVNEFEAFELKPTSGMNDRFGAPEGAHDDCVMACALAWTEVPRRAARQPGQYPGAQREAKPKRRLDDMRSALGSPGERFRR